MATLWNVLTLAAATGLAAAAAIALQWLALHSTLHLMRGATVRKASSRPELVRGTLQVARALASRR